MRLRSLLLALAGLGALATAAAPRDLIETYGDEEGRPVLLARAWDLRTASRFDEASRIYRRLFLEGEGTSRAVALYGWSETAWAAGRPAEALAALERGSALWPDDLEIAARKAFFEAFLHGRSSGRLAADRLDGLAKGRPEEVRWKKRGEDAIAWGLSAAGDFPGATDAFQRSQDVAPSAETTAALENHKASALAFRRNVFGLYAGTALSAPPFSLDAGFGGVYLSLAPENRLRFTAAYSFTGVPYDNKTVTNGTVITTNRPPSGPPPPGGPTTTTNVRPITNWSPRFQHEIVASMGFPLGAPGGFNVVLGGKALITDSNASGNLFSGFGSVGVALPFVEPRLSVSGSFGPLVQAGQAALEFRFRTGWIQPCLQGGLISKFSASPAIAEFPDLQAFGAAWIGVSDPVSPRFGFELRGDFGGRRLWLSPEGFASMNLNENPALELKLGAWVRVDDGVRLHASLKETVATNASGSWATLLVGADFLW